MKKAILVSLLLLFPLLHGCFVGMATSEEEQKEISEKGGDLSEEVKFHEKAQEYTNESLKSKAKSLNDQKAENQKKQRFQTLLAQVRSKDNKETGKEALRFLEQALVLYPDNAEALALKKKIEAYYRTNPGDIITNSIGMKLVYIPAGEFMMGSPSSESLRGRDEGPQHRVKISKGFYIGQTEVTQAQYRAVMGTNPSHFQGDNNPVENVSWNDALTFCRKLSEKKSKTYTLPTEAQWEYACRAGSTTAFSFGNSQSSLRNYAWYSRNSDFKTHPVGQKQPNAFGLYDMHGNLWEWCQDWYEPDYYSNSPLVDPISVSFGSYRVLRGGSWLLGPALCRSAIRYGDAPDNWNGNNGFRVVVLDF
jgi:formylglycine-generating enzyme required for sulfatase activity